MSFRKLRVHRQEIWRRKFLQNRVLSTVTKSRGFRCSLVSHCRRVCAMTRVLMPERSGLPAHAGHLLLRMLHIVDEPAGLTKNPKTDVNLTKDMRYGLPRPRGLLAGRYRLPSVSATSTGPRLDGPHAPHRADRGQFARR